MEQNQTGLKKFPKGFLFGSATSAHQIEGGNFNSDWYSWEKAGGHIKDNASSDPAADSWHKWPEDIELLKKTNQNAYRFSIEWAKIEPQEGQFDEEAINHYKNILLKLKENKITSIVGLHHFTNPLWLDKIGGMSSSRFPKLFARYAEKMVEELGLNADFWITFNEPKVLILKGYIQKEWYPGKRNLIKAYQIYKNINKAHILAYLAMKKFSDCRIGIVQNITAYEPIKDSWLNKLFVKIAQYWDSTIFIKPIIKKTDFLGINYYMKFLIQTKIPFVQKKATLTNDYGWSINQEGLFQVLVENKKWQKPLYVTENGIADENDIYREEFIKQGLENVEKALEFNVPVKGYFYWSLLDNFEWASGYTMKFGLADINRNLRPSAYKYAELIKKYLSD